MEDIRIERLAEYALASNAAFTINKRLASLFSFKGALYLEALMEERQKARQRTKENGKDYKYLYGKDLDESWFTFTKQTIEINFAVETQKQSELNAFFTSKEMWGEDETKHLFRIETGGIPARNFFKVQHANITHIIGMSDEEIQELKIKIDTFLTKQRAIRKANAISNQAKKDQEKANAISNKLNNNNSSTNTETSPEKVSNKLNNNNSSKDTFNININNSNIKNITNTSSKEEVKAASQPDETSLEEKGQIKKLNRRTLIQIQTMRAEVDKLLSVPAETVPAKKSQMAQDRKNGNLSKALRNVMKKPVIFPKITPDMQDVIGYWESLGLKLPGKNTKSYAETLKSIRDVLNGAKFNEQYSADDIKDAIYRFKIAATCNDYMPKNKKPLLGTDLGSFIYNDYKNIKSYFQIYLPNDSLEPVPAFLKPLEDKYPKITSQLKKRYYSEVTGNLSSEKDEDVKKSNAFIKRSIMLKEYFTNKVRLATSYEYTDEQMANACFDGVKRKYVHVERIDVYRLCLDARVEDDLSSYLKEKGDVVCSDDNENVGCFPKPIPIDSNENEETPDPDDDYDPPPNFNPGGIEFDPRMKNKNVINSDDQLSPQDQAELNEIQREFAILRGDPIPLTPEEEKEKKQARLRQAATDEKARTRGQCFKDPKYSNRPISKVRRYYSGEEDESQQSAYP